MSCVMLTPPIPATIGIKTSILGTWKQVIQDTKQGDEHIQNLNHVRTISSILQELVVSINFVLVSFVPDEVGSLSREVI